jgi:threonine/homoserine/homoserine lactone efflux protein
MALILRRAASYGWRRAVPTVLGLEAGLYLWALIAAAGFAALVAVLELAFLVLQVVVGNWFARTAVRRRWDVISGSVDRARRSYRRYRPLTVISSRDGRR